MSIEHLSPDRDQIIITTPQFCEGAKAAWADYGRHSAGPNDDILDRMHPEFAAGYRHEWTCYIEPVIKVRGYGVQGVPTGGDQ